MKATEFNECIFIKVTWYSHRTFYLYNWLLSSDHVGANIEYQIHKDSWHPIFGQYYELRHLQCRKFHLSTKFCSVGITNEIRWIKKNMVTGSRINSRHWVFSYRLQKSLVLLIQQRKFRCNTINCSWIPEDGNLSIFHY